MSRAAALVLACSIAGIKTLGDAASACEPVLCTHAIEDALAAVGDSLLQVGHKKPEEQMTKPAQTSLHAGWKNKEQQEDGQVHVLPTRPVVLSWNPRLVLIDNFLTMDEIEHLRHLGEQGIWGRTALVGINGSSVPGDTITSDIKDLPQRDTIVISVKSRIAEATMLPLEAQEPLRLLRYKPASFFRGHVDAHVLPGRRTSARTATMFINIGEADSMSDGPTYFPMAVPAKGVESVDGILLGQIPDGCSHLMGKSLNQSTSERDSYLDGFDVAGRRPEAKPGEGIAIAPKLGRAIIWWSRRPDGQLDPKSQHAGCPSQRTGGRARKLALTQWIRHLPLVNSDVSQLLDWELCPGWRDGTMIHSLPNEHRTCATSIVEQGGGSKVEFNLINQQVFRDDAVGFFAG